ncbi:ABC transporter substrate-binding protein [Natrinema salifodinae]|uniref:Peptide/nickel transport system substrate-binding protein n=1 Tax=Natrinema salifodinae TaxID=1202768 RepID=A0A1I0NJQ1_9EURY|nr:ABC transporter substrate-binding protein [Natrinema salifodinae]SEW01616.1 peptide/nickel transport system substrate-binding protein [Natrinema salifodinae]
MSNENSLSRRTFLKATGSGAAVATVAGCLTGEPDDEGSDNELNLRNATMSSLDPIQSTDTASGQVIKQVCEPLTHYPNGETRVENKLAEEVEISDDNLTYTFHLKDAEFHNGDSLTADDFVYTFRRLAESENSERSNFIVGDPSFLDVEAEFDDEGRIVPDSLAVEAVDDSTLEITLATPAPDALQILAYDALSVIPEGIVGDIEGYEGELDHNEFANEGLVGTGPFEFDSWDPDADVRVTKYDDYHGSTANVDAVNWQILEGDDARVTAAMEKSLDFFTLPTSRYDPNKVDAETDDRNRQIGTYGPFDENGETVDYVGVPELSTRYLAFNAANTPQSVRQAVAYVTNHAEIVDTIMKGRGQEAWTFLPPGVFPGDYDSFVEDYPYSANENDRDAAREVLEADGYTEDNPYELTITTYEGDTYQEIGRNIRDKLAGTGIEVDLESAPFAALQERGENGDLEAYTLGWTWSWPDPGYGMFGFEPANTDTARMPEETNGYYLDWDDVNSDAAQKAQSAWDTVVANPDPEAEDTRAEAYREMEEAIWEDAVMIPMFHDLKEQFYYDHVDVEPFGAMGEYQQVFNNVTLDE